MTNPVTFILYFYRLLPSTPRNEESSLSSSSRDVSDVSTDRSRQRGSISEIERSTSCNQLPSDVTNIPSTSGFSSGKPPSKRKGRRPRKVVRSGQTEEHSSKRKKDSST